MRVLYNEVKTIQAAVYLIKKRGQDFMSYMKLIKLLYLADRTALLKWGRPITYDCFVAMDNGMVLSRTLNLINEEPSKMWNKIFNLCGDHELQLVQPNNIGTEELSKMEIDLLDEIYREFGSKSRWELRDYTHNLEEWRDPMGSSIPIEISDVLRAGGKTASEIQTTTNELESVSLVTSMFGAE